MTEGNGSNPLPEGVTIDRSRLAHRDTKQLALLELRMRKAEAAGDIEQLDLLMNQADGIAERLIVEVPDDWYVPGTPAEAKCPSPGWLDWLQSDKYRSLMKASRAPEPGDEGN